MEIFWFVILLISFFDGVHAANTFPNTKIDDQESLQNIGIPHAQMSESTDNVVDAAGLKAMQGQLNEINTIQTDMLKVLNAMSQKVQNIETNFMKKLDEVENRINEATEKWITMVKNGEKGNNTDVGEMLDGESDLRNVNGLVETVDALKHTMLEIQRSTALLTVTTVKKTDLPYIPRCEQTDTDSEMMSYENVCLQAQLDTLYQDLSGVLHLHVAIIGDTPSKGRVELFYNGKHGSICDYFFGYEEAMVVCRMLGFSKGYSQCCGRLGKGQGEIMSGKMICTGEEESLYVCDHDEIGHYEGDCNHEYDVGVICS